MSAILLDQFDTTVNTPEAVDGLRRLVLDLAVRGRLVAQDPSDEPASMLLKRIATEKSRRFKAGEIRKPKTLPPIGEHEQPYKVTEGWAWTRLGAVAEIGIGRTPPTKSPEFWAEGEIPWVSISDMEDYGTVTKTKRTVTQEAADDVFKYPPKEAGTLLMSFKLTIGRTALLGVDGYHNEAIASIEPYPGVLQSYLMQFLPMFSLGGDSNSAIMGQTLNSQSMREILIPVPPEAEQLSIVSRVDELMALCDQLSDQLTRRDARRQQWAASTVRHLSEDAPIGSDSAWTFAETHFDTLLATPESVPQLRKLVLDLAIRGKLTQRDLDDEPASALLQRIEAEKTRLSKNGEIRKPKPLPPVDDEETPFHVPEGWAWTRLGNLTEIARGITFPTSAKSKTPLEGRVACLRTSNVQESIEWDDLLFVDESYVKRADQIVRDGDVIISMANSYALVGKVAQVRHAPVRASYGGFLSSIRGYGGDPDYLYWLLRSPYMQDGMRATSSQTTNIANISLRGIRPLLVPVPPLAEQRRIVARVGELMALCDSLDAKLATAEHDAERLMRAVLEEALAPSLPGHAALSV